MDKALLKIAGKSALKNTTLPILICSRDGCLRMKTIGAEQYLGSLETGRNLMGILSPELRAVLAEADEKAVRSGLVLINQREYPVLAGLGTVKGEPYLALLFEQGSPFARTMPSDPAAALAYQRLSQDLMDEIRRLLALPFRAEERITAEQSLKNSDRRLKQAKKLTALAARELAFMTTNRQSGGDDGVSNLSVVIAALSAHSANLFKAIGYRLQTVLPPSAEGMAVNARWETAMLIVSVCTLTVLHLSEAHEARLTCRILPGDFPSAELMLLAEMQAENTDLPSEGDLQDLAACLPVFSMELLICRALMKKLKWTGTFRREGTGLSLLCEIPLSHQICSRLESPGSPAYEISARLLDMLLAALFSG